MTFVLHQDNTHTGKWHAKTFNFLRISGENVFSFDTTGMDHIEVLLIWLEEQLRLSFQLSHGDPLTARNF